MSRQRIEQIICFHNKNNSVSFGKVARESVSQREQLRHRGGGTAVTTAIIFFSDDDRQKTPKQKQQNRRGPWIMEPSSRDEPRANGRVVGARSCVRDDDLILLGIDSQLISIACQSSPSSPRGVARRQWRWWKLCVPTDTKFLRPAVVGSITKRIVTFGQTH